MNYLHLAFKSASMCSCYFFLLVIYKCNVMEKKIIVVNIERIKERTLNVYIYYFNCLDRNFFISMNNFLTYKFHIAVPYFLNT